MADTIVNIYHAWKVSGIISVLLLAAAFLVLMLALRMSMKVIKNVSKDSSLKGLFSLSLMVFLIYSLIVFVSLRTSGFPPHLVTGVAIFLGACFCYSAVNVLKSFVKRFYQEISKRKKVESKIKKLAIVDDTTGLYNYRGFLNIIEHHLLLAKRNKSTVLLCYVDIENIQSIKDELGHQESKLMILETAKLLKASFRKSDVIARVTESEFMALLVGSTKDHTSAIEKNFREKLDAYNARRTQKYQLPIHFCITSYDPEFNQMFENIHAQADDFMRDIKKAKDMALALH
ncbi:MAG: GGDEF domain-containing protein [Nitrospiraceae bacterium]|nr:MAG: GGDEF domain-containing protein [Nitrospiraceae bacterium]